MAFQRSVYVAFASFGGLWGVWGAALPTVQHAAGVSVGQLGVALVCIGVGALPAMLMTGRAVDRFGGRVVAMTSILLALSGAAVATTAADFVTLAMLLLVLGAMSGATDVGINAVAGAAERATGQPVLTRAHGTFSAAVVVSSLITGGIEAMGLPVAVAFGLVVVAAVVAAVSLWQVRLTIEMGRSATAVELGSVSKMAWLLPLVIIGLIGALAFAVENAYQSWGAVFLRDQLSVVGGRTAAAPAVFAAVAAATRFAAGAFKRLPAGPLLTAGAAAAAVGSMLLAYSSTLVTALIALALAAGGTSILFPTLLREALSGVGPEARGRGTSAVATTAYLGFLLGPVYVGSLASATGLRNAIIGVAALAAVTAVIAWPVARWAGKTVTRPTEGSAQPDVDGAAPARARGPRRLPQMGPPPGESGARAGLLVPSELKGRGWRSVRRCFSG